MELTPELVTESKLSAGRTLAREFGNTMLFGPIDVRQRSADCGSVIEVAVTCAEVQGIPGETRGAAAMAGAVEQLRELGIHNRIEYSFVAGTTVGPWYLALECSSGGTPGFLPETQTLLARLRSRTACSARSPGRTGSQGFWHWGVTCRGTELAPTGDSI